MALHEQPNGGRHDLEKFEAPTGAAGFAVVGPLVDQEVTLRRQKRRVSRMSTSASCVASTGCCSCARPGRDWVCEHRHCPVTSACGTGKSFIACVLVGPGPCRRLEIVEDRYNYTDLGKLAHHRRVLLPACRRREALEFIDDRHGFVGAVTQSCVATNH